VELSRLNLNYAIAYDPRREDGIAGTSRNESDKSLDSNTENRVNLVIVEALSVQDRNVISEGAVQTGTNGLFHARMAAIDSAQSPEVYRRMERQQST